MATSTSKALAPEIKKNSHKFAKDINKILEKCVEIQNRRIVGPSIDYNLSQSFIYHPKHCLFTKHRQDMYYAYCIGGSQKLSEYLYGFARHMYRIDAAGNRFSWKYLLDDEVGPKHTPFILNTIHPEVIKALICGNLNYRLQVDPSFLAVVSPLIQKRTFPGIYCLQWYDTGSGSLGSSQVDPRRREAKGKGFSPAQLRMLFDRTRLYMTNTPAGLTYAKHVDDAFTADKDEDRPDYKSNPNARRYLTISQHIENLNKWRETLKEQVLDKARQVQKLWNEQCTWSPTTVGYGANCSQRSSQHLDNTSTSKLFGLLNAIIRVEFGNQFKCEAHQIVYITDGEHNNLAEPLISSLGSSYHDMGGTNAKRGGALGSGDQQTNTTANRKRNIELLFKKPYRSGFRFGLQYQKERTVEMEQSPRRVDRKKQKADDLKELERFKEDVKDTAQDLQVLDNVSMLAEFHRLTEEIEEKMRFRAGGSEEEAGQEVSSSDNEREGGNGN